MNKAYKTDFSKWSLRFTDVLDTGIIFAILYAAFLLLCKGKRYAWIALPLALLLALLLLWVSVNRRHTIRKRETERSVQEDLLGRILIMRKEQTEALAPDIKLLQKSKVDTDDLLPYLRTDTDEIWLCGDLEKGAERFVERFAPGITIHTKEETALLWKDRIPAGSEVVLAESQKHYRIPPLSEWFSEWRPNRFTAIGVLLTALSFFVRYRLYFRLLASASFLLGSIIKLRKSHGYGNFRQI